PVPAGPLNFPIVLQHGERRNLDVVFTPSALGDRGAIMTVDSDDAETPSVELRATGVGIVAGRPRLSTRAFVEFGRVQTGAANAAVLALEIRNVGNAPLTVDRVELDAHGDNTFTLPAPPAPGLTIGPGDAVSVDIRFSPTDDGVRRSALIVEGGGQGSVVNLV